MKGTLKNKILAVLTTVCVMLGIYRKANIEDQIKCLETSDKDYSNISTTPVASMPEKPTTGKLIMNPSRRNKEEDGLDL
ncbi:MAG: hypothetical protein IJY90_00555 [Clostridia bacterium]|nr:hypothetical protein [Clostridia bacterium]